MSDRIKRILSALKEFYPEASCSLEYSAPHELLFATRLSAQCTDARVNIVTEELFEKYKTLEDFAAADVGELESIIHSCGFYRTKARDIINCANMLISDFEGVIPDNIETLCTLPGVGRKTANLIVGDLYGKSAIVADTHCIRLSNRLGLVSSKDPYKVEMALRSIIPEEESSDFCHRLVLFGREVCSARSPKCDECPLRDLCPSYKSH